MKQTQKWILIAVAALAVFGYQKFLRPSENRTPAQQTQAVSQRPGGNSDGQTAQSGGSDGFEQILQEAYDKQRSNIQIEGEGTVAKTLPDDNKGSRHQRFILKLSGGQSLLVAHNIDLAPKIKGLKKGDTVAFNGEYEWSQQGGVIHWTHHDPQGRHADGWLKHNGQVYQ
ncbi:DUF3465 domain-containing protein [Neisseria chenwenguii]|uniref:Uncharacterized protein n=1 Tax=Neisseria chenwenguii TaxID=1853278 RepID=A0A220RZ67_9NEIS|nr:DUF3465 domain-containing protein [Neisseria chenwenguii]ASK26511.1 hypothetical protein BG910_00990 [Neisseria chenwenguii]ROV55953.1 DUF3465 domain-containing protein [Neisseria chenwenguii]